MKTNLSKRKKGRLDSSLFLRTFSLLALLVVGIGASWAQDAVFDMGIMSPSLTSGDGKETLTFADGGIEDVHESDGITDLSENASMTLHGVNARYIRITFGDESTTYNLKWGGGNDAKNPVSGKGSIILVSNYGSDNIKIVNDTEKGTTKTPIKKVEVFYHQQGFCNNTDGHTEATAETNTISDLTCVNNIIAVGKTIDFSKINVVGQYCSFSPNNGKGIMMNTSGEHYLSIKFDGEVNLGDLTNFQIEGTNVTKQDNAKAVFDEVLFVCTGGDVSKSWEPSNCSFTIGNEQSVKLKKTKEIRIKNNGNEGTFTISAIKFVFGGDHTKTTPVLNGGTTANMEVMAGEAFTLSATNGFWREYKDDLSGPKDGGIISGYETVYTFSDGLAAGEYNFGVIDDTWACTPFGQRHKSDFVTVHVSVKAPETEKNVYMYNLNDFPIVSNEGNVNSTAYDAGVVTMVTHGGGNNYVKLLDWTDEYKNKNYTGVRIDAKGDRFRVIVKTSDGKSYNAFVEKTDYATLHFKWSDFSSHTGEGPMPADAVAKITEIGIAGNTSGDDTQKTHYIRHIWLDAIYNNDYDHAFVFYGEEGGIYNGDYTYTLQTSQGESTAKFTSITGGDRTGKQCMILRKGRELLLTPPEGYKIASLRMSFSEKDTKYCLSFNSGNTVTPEAGEVGNYVDYTNTSENDGVRIVIRSEFTDEMTLPISKIEFTLARLEKRSINVTYGGETKVRQYKVHIPSSGLTGKVPVLFSLHGAANDWEGAGVANYDDVADNKHFIVVYPRGLEGRIWGKNRGWLSNGVYNEDVKFFEDVIQDLKNEFASWRDGFEIDESRIYMTGFSNGGMMTYSTAFTSDKFAGFAAVSGYQLNEYHLQHYGNGEWQGSHPVPFMHIHGKADGFVPYADIQPIIDNMVYRNGCNPVPAHTSVANADKYVYSAISGNCPFVYYAVDGMGHSEAWNIEGTTTQNVVWNFVSQFTRIDMSDYNGRNRTEFKPVIEQAGFDATQHGWKRDLGNNILWQYGDKPSEYLDGPHHLNNSEPGKVYHTIQLGSGWHNLQFTASSDAQNTSTMWVKVKLERLGKLGGDDSGSTYTTDSKVVYEEEYNLGDISININDGLGNNEVGEYRLTFYWYNSDATADGIEAGKAIQISNIGIVNGTNASYGVIHNETPRTGFEGYFPFEQRLIAQWNFDLCDGARFNRQSLGSPWVADNADKTNGVITYTYTGTLGTDKNNGVELNYGGSNSSVLIPITAGLKFYAPANTVKMQVYVQNGAMTRTQLVLEPGVYITVPYVRNTFRNDAHNNGNTNAQFEDYKDCIHHINRDILYVSSSPDFFDAIHNDVMPYSNDGNNTQNSNMFHTGGTEVVRGAKAFIPEWEKLNYCGEQGGPCTIEIVQTVTIDRMAVNRNLASSFYTEYLKLDANVDVPYPGLRFVGTPRGSKVESVGTTYADYSKAIAMTFGGWTYNSNTYSVPDVADQVKDSWAEPNVYHGDGAEGNQDYNIGKINVANVPLATDGFPVYSRMTNKAFNENVNPNATNDHFDINTLSYHDRSYGQFYLSTNDDGSYQYVENVTPWSLPCRGAYVKFEPTYPGVLNVHLLQEANAVYYIADELGNLVKTNIFTKTGTGQDVLLKNNKAGHFYIAQKDNVKYTFDVYPGKSYYIFSNTDGLGFTGYCFEPYVYMLGGISELERQDVGIKTASLKDAGYDPSNPELDLTWDNETYIYTNQTAGSDNQHDGRVDVVDPVKTKQEAYAGNASIVYSNKAVHVTCNRQFTANTWGTICLPYSMNHLQFEEVFGVGAKVVLMRDVQKVGKNGYNKTTVNFIYHQNQDIIAGYPYLVYPTKDVTSVVSNAYIPETTPSIVSINGIGQNTVTHPGAVDYKATAGTFNYDGLKCYDFTGNFTPQSLPKGSYVIASDGNLTRLPAEQTAAPYRAYLKYNIEADGGVFHVNSRIDAMSFGDDSLDDVVNIEDLLLDSGIVGGKTNVYSVNGQLIRENTDDLSNLPKGVYIVNGKKYFVK